MLHIVNVTESGDPIVTTSIEDVEKIEHGIIIEFLCPLGEDFDYNKTAIRFRLTVAEEKIRQVLSMKREDLMFRYLDEQIPAKSWSQTGSGTVVAKGP